MSEAVARGADVNAHTTAESLRGPHLPDDFWRGFASLSPTLLALKLGYGHLIGWLLDHGAEPNPHFPWGASLLGYTIATKNVDACALLLRRGADPHADANRFQLLRDARDVEQIEILRVLLDAGAPIDPAPSNPGVLPLRDQLARMARQHGDEALAVRIENTPLG